MRNMPPWSATRSPALWRGAQVATPAEQPQYLVRAPEALKAAFTHPSRQLEQTLSRDTEEGGDLFTLANTPPSENAINERLRRRGVLVETCPQNMNFAANWKNRGKFCWSAGTTPNDGLLKSVFGPPYIGVFVMLKPSARISME